VAEPQVARRRVDDHAERGGVRREVLRRRETCEVLRELLLVERQLALLLLHGGEVVARLRREDRHAQLRERDQHRARDRDERIREAGLAPWTRQSLEMGLLPARRRVEGQQVNVDDAHSLSRILSIARRRTGLARGLRAASSSEA